MIRRLKFFGVISSCLLVAFFACLLWQKTVSAASGGAPPAWGGGCGSWFDYCIGGGWMKYNVTSTKSSTYGGPNNEDYFQITVPSGANVDGGRVERCRAEDATEYYRLALVWYQGDLTGQQVGLLPVNQFKDGGGSATYNTNIGGVLPWSDVHEKFEEAKRHNQTNTEWKDTAWFCYNPNWASYSSKSNVYSSGAGTVTSNWVDKATDTSLKISATPGSTVTISFNHYLKASSATSSTTDWNVKRTMPSTHGGVTFSDSNGSSSNFASLGSPVSGTLKTADKNEHTVPIAGGNGHGRSVQVNLPAASYAGESYSIQICEYLTYQGDSKKNKALNKGSHVCATINVNSGTVGKDCPLPLSIYSPPAKGTIDSGTTSGGSGIVSNVYTTYSQFIYVKPHDQVSWAHCYNPEAQTVLKMTKDRSSQNSDESSHSDTSHGIDEWTRYASFSNVGTRTKYVATSNTATIDYSAKGSYSPSANFVTPSAGYSMSGATLSGAVGDRNGAVIYSVAAEPNSYTVKEGYAGTTEMQAIRSSIGTNSVSPDYGWTWTYPITYHAANTCVDKEAHWEPNATDPKRKWVETTYKPKEDCPQSGTGTGYGSHPAYYDETSTTSEGEASRASYYIPYNFTTGTTSSITSVNNEVVISGEPFNVSGQVSILPRYNATTQGLYATEPPSGTVAKLITFYINRGTAIPSGSSSSSANPCTYYGARNAHGCKEVSEKTSGWNGVSYDSGAAYNMSARVEGYDLEIGDYICSAVGIFPADSGDDTNGNGSGKVSDNWNISSPSCRTVAKKPNLQVWGNSVFTNGLIRTSTAFKAKTYGSWSEFAIIAGGNNSQVRGMGSGATLSGGNSSSLFFLRTPLTIPNDKCRTEKNKTCTSTGASGISGTATITNRLISRFTNLISGSDTHNSAAGSVNLSSNYSFVGKYRITHTNTAATSTRINFISDKLPAGVTHIVYVEKGDLDIMVNIINSEDNNGEYYKKPKDIPQYVFIVKDGNIRINSNVDRIDAWLIAENGTLYTCANQTVGNLAHENCQSSLTINGPVIAQKIIANRTYGAGAGANTGVPAEVFNLPLSSYLWAYAQAYDDAKIYTVYTRQLAPRL